MRSLLRQTPAIADVDYALASMAKYVKYVVQDTDVLGALLHVHTFMARMVDMAAADCPLLRLLDADRLLPTPLGCLLDLAPDHGHP